MAITYDEVWITTSREVKVCLDAIRAYEKELRLLEENHHINPEDLLQRIQRGYVPQGHEARWYESHLGLMRTKKRLEDLKGFLG